MKRILIFLYFILNSYNVFAIEWNQKAFEESLHKYKKTIKEAIEEPKKYKEKVVESYKYQYEEIKRALEDETEEFLDNRTYYVLRDLGGRSKDYLYANDGYSIVYYLKRDSIDLFYFLDDISEQAPLISPLKRELYKRVDYLRFQGYFYRSAIRSMMQQKR